MHNLVKKVALAFLLHCFGPFGLLFSQNVNISFKNPDRLFVCDADTMWVNLENTGATNATDARLTLNLPAGFRYVKNSVTGATEFQVSDPTKPQFAIAVLSAGQSRTAAFVLEADCTAKDAFNAGQLFAVGANFASAQANGQATSDNVKLETGLILTQSIVNQYLEGERFDTLYRTVRFTNTRLGPVSNIVFEDSHVAGYTATTSEGKVEKESPTFLKVLLDGSFLSKFGNKDDRLDIGETAEITQRLIVTDCGTPTYNANSILRVGWGCNTVLCQYDSIPASVLVKKSSKIQDLQIKPVWDYTHDHCGDRPAKMALNIKNVGRADAVNVLLNLNVPISDQAHSGFAIGSFSIVDSKGSNNINPNVVEQNQLNACQKSALKKAGFVIPKVAAQDSIRFEFDVITCIDSCQQALPTIQVGYFYRKDCPPNGVVSDTFSIVPDFAYQMRSKPIVAIGECMEEGKSYPIITEISSARLTQTSGFVHIEYILPLGLSLDPTCPVLLGGIQPVLMKTKKVDTLYTSVEFVFQLPLSQDSATVEWCVKYKCDTLMPCQEKPKEFLALPGSDCNPCLLQVRQRVFWSEELTAPSRCGIGPCFSFPLAVNKVCFPPGDGEDPIVTEGGLGPGVKGRWRYNVLRLNVDYQDDNNDRQADSGQKAKAPGVRLDRFLPGDTIRFDYQLRIDSGNMKALMRGFFFEILRSDFGGPDGQEKFPIKSAQNEFTDQNKIYPVGSTRLRVKYADGKEVMCDLSTFILSVGRQYYEVGSVNTIPIKAIDEFVSLRHISFIPFDTLFKNGCTPKNTLGPGDSLFIINDFKIDVNFAPLTDAGDDPPLIGFRAGLANSPPLYLWKTPKFQPTYLCQYSGFRKRTFSSQNGIKACESSVSIRPWRYRLRIARENMFPFEVRPLAVVKRYAQNTPGIVMEKARLRYLALQDSSVLLSNLELPFEQKTDSVLVDFSPAFQQTIDEGFMLGFEPVFGANCRFDKPDSSVQRIQIYYKECFTKPRLVEEKLLNKLGYFSNSPDIGFQSKSTIIASEGLDFQYEFDINNQIAAAADHLWVALISPSGKMSDFQMLNVQNLQTYPQTNGIFQLGQLQGFDLKKLLLRGKNEACELDSVLIVYGWDCQPPSSLAAASCLRDTVVLKLIPQNPELEMDIISEPNSITLCDTSSYFEFEIFNAKNGSAYQFLASVKLPDGLRIAPNTSQISYPAGTPWKNLSEPNQNGSVFFWSAPQLNADLAQKGLPGVTTDPQNKFRVRFKVTAECGFVSNAQPFYGTRGKNACGQLVNELNKSGKPLVVNGLTASYGVQLNAGLLPGGAPTCGSEMEYEVQAKLLGSPSATDSVYVSLPLGASYVPGSYKPVQNAPAGEPTLQSGGFRVALPAGAAANTNVVFRYKILLNNQVACTENTMTVQTRIRSQAFCKTLGKPCDVYIATGEQQLKINILRPLLALDKVVLVEKNGSTEMQISVKNDGTAAIEKPVLQIWQDINGDGKIAPPDQLIQTLSGGLLPPGQSSTLIYTSNLAPEQFCDLLLRLPASENCQCDDEILPINTANIAPKTIQVCEIQPLAVGVPASNGFTYKWLTPGVLPANSATATYTPTNVKPGQTVNLVLEAKSDNCTILRQFDLKFAEKAVLVSSPNVICRGETSILGVSPVGIAYTWSGQGLSSTNTASPSVKPLNTSTYLVTVTFESMCTATASVQVTVLPTDSVLLPALNTCVGNPVQVLGQKTDKPGFYNQKLKNANGCDSTVVQQLIVHQPYNITENKTICMGDTLRLFDTLLTQNGTVCRSFKSINGCDSIQCVKATFSKISPPLPVISDTLEAEAGKPITLVGPAGYKAYTWIPPGTTCVCPTFVVTPDSTGLSTYTLQVSDANGCKGELSFRVLVLPPCEQRKILIPNAFTPNGDGVNDLFRAVPCEGCGSLAKLTIYDRWGNRIFDSGTSAPAWDGTVDGKPSPPDVYVWIIEVACGDGKVKKTGGVSLLR